MFRTWLFDEATVFVVEVPNFMRQASEIFQEVSRMISLGNKLMARVMRVSSKEWRQLVKILSNLKGANSKG